MSVSCTFSLVEAAMVAGMLPSLDFCAGLRARLLGAESQGENQGAATFSMVLSPLEQGAIFAAMAGISCHFASDFRTKFALATAAKMQSLGVTTSSAQAGGSSV